MRDGAYFSRLRVGAKRRKAGREEQGEEGKTEKLEEAQEVINMKASGTLISNAVYIK